MTEKQKKGQTYFSFDKEMKIVKEVTFRSTPHINMSDDMVRVTLDMARREWRKLKKQVRKSERSNKQ